MGEMVKLPSMGEGIVEAIIGNWLKEVGETIEIDEPLVEVETDKVTTEVAADVAGTILEILVRSGETAAVGQPLVVIGEPGEPAQKKAPASVPAALEGVSASAPLVEMKGEQERGSVVSYRGRVSPVVSRMVKEHQVDLNLIVGTGKNGRVTKRDVQSYLASKTADVAITAPVSLPDVVLPSSKTGRSIETAAPLPVATAGTLHPHTNMRRRIAEHMVRSKGTSPHVTTVFEIDFSRIAAHRQAHKASFAAKGVKLTYMAYIAAAVVAGLQKVPQVNSRWHEDGIFWHQTVNLGIATAVPDGLVVPVVRQAETKNLLGLAHEISDYAAKARDNRLQPSDLQGGTFTITNHGVFGSLIGTPIINQPQCGILGIGLVEKRVCVVDDMIAIRPKSYFSFSFDHRILDGADADRFMQVVKRELEDGDTSG